MKKRKVLLALISLLLLCSMALGLTSCSTGLEIRADDLMDGISARSVNGKETDEAFVKAQTELALKLFKASARENKNENVLISPLSIYIALAMATNGANGETLAEMEALLGGDIPIETLNEYIYSYVEGLDSSEKAKLSIANSIWIRDIKELHVNTDFLQKNADYYGADIYKAPFNQRTVKDINNWVKQNTDSMIDEIVDKIDPDTVMFLINALLFDAEWASPYTEYAVKDGEFTSISGEKCSAEIMSSTERRYISDESAVGFIKSYEGGKYGFAVLLPNEGIDLYEYIDSLSADDLQRILNGVRIEEIDAKLPKFSHDYEIELSGILQDFGVNNAFSAGADFSRLGYSERGNISISRVLHKTSITVAEKGTKAGAATEVAWLDSIGPSPRYNIILDRPFIYMIIDCETNTPIFIGTVTDINS